MLVTVVFVSDFLGFNMAMHSVKDIAKMTPNVIPVTNDFIAPTQALCKQDQSHVIQR